MSTSIRQNSRVDYTTEAPANNDMIKLGALLRIADATELMAKRYSELIAQRDQYQRSMDYWREQYDAIERRNRSLRGQVTKMRNKLAAKKEQQP